jgi:hypothetical protein
MFKFLNPSKVKPAVIGRYVSSNDREIFGEISAIVFERLQFKWATELSEPYRDIFLGYTWHGPREPFEAEWNVLNEVSNAGWICNLIIEKRMVEPMFGDTGWICALRVGHPNTTKIPDVGVPFTDDKGRTCQIITRETDKSKFISKGNSLYPQIYIVWRQI